MFAFVRAIGLQMNERADLLCGAGAIATYLGLTETQVRNLIRTAVLPTFKLGNKLCARRSMLDELLAQREAEANREREVEAA